MNAPQERFLKDYLPPEYLIDNTQLSFFLEGEHTRVCSKLSVRLNSLIQKSDGFPVLVLDGVDLELLSIQIDGQTLDANDYRQNDDSLSIQISKDAFELEIETKIFPQKNTALEGLYVSKGMYCTQCEAHGFRRITYYLDRPDVMSSFEVYIEADKAAYPILLSNGNLLSEGESENGRHWAKWQDPFKKPSYLFALVAGDLSCVDDTFTRQSGKPVALKLYVEPHDVDKCEFALDSLKRAMRWDEEVFGCEYDLDIYMIVAVSHFNMGAMENKGLNIFNTSCVLAKTETTTDAGFQRVEGVVAHEYFHNWSGNRVTCRDWFQLSLKEGFTVFRDEEFSSDMGSRTVKRIDDVNLLRTHQFKEDAGPMSHPIRPASYIEMNNFYTATVYNKGAEVVRMIKTILGPDKFRKGSDRYFEKHDGQAVTCDDFVAAMESTSDYDFSQFKRWYAQSGTPLVEVQSNYDAGTKTLKFGFKQSCADSAKQKNKEAFVIPVTLALFSSSGEKLSFRVSGEREQASHKEWVFLLSESEEELVLENVSEPALPSLLRAFSAPVRLKYAYSRADLANLLRFDDDGFNAWEAGQKLAIDVITELMDQFQSSQALVVDSLIIDAFGVLLDNDGIDKALLSRLITLPSKAYMAEQNSKINVDAIVVAHDFLEKQIAQHFKEAFLRIYKENESDEEYQPDTEQIAQRALKNKCLHYLSMLDDTESFEVSVAQFRSASNMTDQSAALKSIIDSSDPEKNELIEQFYQQWQDEALVIDQWFTLQCLARGAGTIDKVNELLAHGSFDLTNPNRVRSVLGAMVQNFAHFHQADGAAYALLGDQVASLNTTNPQVAARMVSALIHWKRYDEKRSTLMKAVLEKLLKLPELSKDVFEIVSKALD